MTTKRIQDEILFWESFIDHWEQVHGERAPGRAYDALSFAKLRLKCKLEEAALRLPDDTTADQ